MRIAHLSDLHLLSLVGVSLRRWLGKRLTGYANLRLKRNHTHHPSHVRAVAREIARQQVDHVVITGDLTNLAFESEFALAKEIIAGELKLSPSHVSVVPGNHDLYTRGALRSRRFTEFFSEYTRCELGLAVDVGCGHFPYVKLRGPAAIIGLSSAVPRLPLVASGRLGAVQLEALGLVLAHPEVRRRTPVLLVHHPLHNPTSRIETVMRGLSDASALSSLLCQLDRGLVLHGHLHRRVSRTLVTTRGEVRAIGATSASLSHPHAARMSGFNVYEIDDATGAIGSVTAHVLNQAGDAFHLATIPEG